jgi:predicted GIY-YIG superfamily endonuclease
MPKVPVDYSKTCIYKLVHKEDINDENIYIGHTTDMTKRKYEHKSHCNNPNSKQYNCKKYQFIRENGGWENWEMILVENYPCKDVNEAKAKERQHQVELKSKLNSDIVGRTKEEWSNDNKNKIIEYKEKYQTNNKEIIIERSKKHYQENIDKKLEYQKQRYYDKRETINQMKKEKIKCNICGFEGRKTDLARHQKSKKCINYNINKCAK